MRPNLYLKIYGDVANGLSKKYSPNENIHLLGFMPNLKNIYEDADIVINPVRFGGGLKIKNVEAMGNSLSLITTTHGTTGIVDAAPDAISIADTPREFIETLISLINGYRLGQNLSEKVYEYAVKNFSEEMCFRPFLNILN